jgi:hypothetical protein
MTPLKIVSALSTTLGDIQISIFVGDSRESGLTMVLIEEKKLGQKILCHCPIKQC